MNRELLVTTACVPYMAMYRLDCWSVNFVSLENSLCIYMRMFVFKFFEFVLVNCKLVFGICFLHFDEELLVAGFERCSRGHCRARNVFGGTGIAFG